MSSEGSIDYEGLTQDAMRGVVRRVLENTVRDGLPGDHHFYVSFDTLAPGVILSKRLRDKYAEEMTIVLQHRFWDLAVGEDYFEVKLTFDGIPERLVVPFQAIKVFFDPSVRYGLQFEAVDLTQGGGTPSVVVERGDLDGPMPAPMMQRPDHPPPPTLIDQPSTALTELQTDSADDTTVQPFIAATDSQPPSIVEDGEAPDADTDQSEDDSDSDTKVVSLDAFRKK